jgi:catechol 2,3-dioxygenase-like lactoylglutathione lyase family enzyme
MAPNDNPRIEETIAPVSGLVPMLPVSNVERSVAFYKLLGFAVGNRVPRDGPMNWAWLYAPNVPDWRRGPNLMLTLSNHVVPPDLTRILFYFYASNLVALREELLRAGQSPGPIQYPEYLPKGELRLLDPDGYCLMIAQSTTDTP